MAIGPPILDRVVGISLHSESAGNADVSKFSDFPQLEFILLLGSQMSADERTRLRELCPNARVVYSDLAEQPIAHSSAGQTPLSADMARATLDVLRPARLLVDEPDGSTRTFAETELMEWLSQF
jgi:hypothetical protein